MSILILARRRRRRRKSPYKNMFWTFSWSSTCVHFPYSCLRNYYLIRKVLNIYLAVTPNSAPFHHPWGEVTGNLCWIQNIKKWITRYLPPMINSSSQSLPIHSFDHAPTLYTQTGTRINAEITVIRARRLYSNPS